MYGKDQWRGREVEGRYSDMMTYFVRDLGSGIKVELYEEYPHYYFTIEYMMSARNSDKWQNHKNLYDPIRVILDSTNLFARF